MLNEQIKLEINGSPCKSEGRPLNWPVLPVNTTFSSIRVREDQITDGVSAQSKDKIIRDLIAKIRKNRQILEEHNFVLMELQDRKPNAVKEEFGNKETNFVYTHGVNKRVSVLIAMSKIKNVINLRPTDKSSNIINIFGFSDVTRGSINLPEITTGPKDRLTFNEATMLQTSLENGLTRKCRNIIENYDGRQYKILIAGQPELSTTSCLANLKLAQFRQINADVHQVNALLSKEYKIYKDTVDLRVLSGDVVNKLTSCLKLHIEAAVTKSRALEMKMNNNIYKENKHVWEAINKLHSILEAELNSCKTQLQKLQRDEELHKKMAGNATYNKILMEYKELQKLIRQKKMIIQKLP